MFWWCWIVMFGGWGLQAWADPPHSELDGMARTWTPHADDAERWEGRPSLADTRGTNTAGRDRGTSTPPGVTVYGYWPYWGDDLDTVAWDSLTHIAIFDVELEATGTLNSTNRWHDNAAEAMALAEPHGVRVHLCVTSFSSSIMDTVLSSSSLRAKVIEELVELVDEYGAHGVNVDFEGLPVSVKSEFVTFVEDLNEAVDDVFVAMPAVDWEGSYDYDELALASHGLFIMGYEYYGCWGNPGPNAPLYGGDGWSSYNLSWSVEDYQVWGAPSESLILGLPLYAHQWETTGSDVPGTTSGDCFTPTYETAVSDALGHGRHWDSVTHTPYAFPSAYEQLWYDDVESLSDKIQYALDEGLQGFGFWALTYDAADADLWDAVDDLTFVESTTSDSGSATDTGSSVDPSDVAGEPVAVPDRPELRAACGCIAPGIGMSGWFVPGVALVFIRRRRA